MIDELKKSKINFMLTSTINCRQQKMKLKYLNNNSINILIDKT